MPRQAFLPSNTVLLSGRRQYQLSDSSVSGCGARRTRHLQWAQAPGEQGHKRATPINAFVQLSIPPTDRAEEHFKDMHTSFLGVAKYARIYGIPQIKKLMFLYRLCAAIV